MTEVDAVALLRSRAARCRELAANATDEEVAGALHETAGDIDAAISVLDGGGSPNESVEG